MSANISEDKLIPIQAFYVAVLALKSALQPVDYRCKILPAGIHRQRHLYYS